MPMMTPHPRPIALSCVARSRVRPMVRMYIAHVGVDPPGVTAPGRRCGLDGGLHRGSIASDPGPNPTRKPHEPCACSPLSGPTYGADVHSSCGGRPTWSDCSRPSLQIGRRWHRGSIAWYPGPNPTRKPHEPCACSPLSGPTYGALVHSSRGGRPTWSDCSRPSLRIGRWVAPWLDRMGPGPQPHAQTA